MECLNFAVALEYDIKKQIQNLHASSTCQTQSLLNLLMKLEDGFCDLLTVAQAVKNASSYPEIETDSLVGADSMWDKVEEGILSDTNVTHNLVFMWSIYNLFEKSAQFYQQSMYNSPYPSTRLFFSSLFEVKKMIKRRLDMILRRIYNRVWSKVGFAPFLLGKE